MFKTAVISLRQIAPKTPLVYTCNHHRELERDKSCIKICLCNRALRGYLSEKLRKQIQYLPTAGIRKGYHFLLNGQ